MDYFNNRVKFEILKGKTLTEMKINEPDGLIEFKCSDGSEYRQYHESECCECVNIEDVCGEVENLIGTPILLAEEVFSDKNPKSEHEESFTWTFYKLVTFKGAVTIRWYGSSNGCYSETASLYEVKKEGN